MSKAHFSITINNHTYIVKVITKYVQNMYYVCICVYKCDLRLCVSIGFICVLSAPIYLQSRMYT